MGSVNVLFVGFLCEYAAIKWGKRMCVHPVSHGSSCSSMGSKSWLDLLPRQTNTRLLNRSVWSLLEFAFNGLIFLLLGLQLPDIIKAVASHETSLWPTLLYRCVDVLAIFLVLLVLRFVWVQSIWRLSIDLLERRLRLKTLRAQRLELYSLSRHHQIGDDVLREVLGELDLSEAKLGQVK